MWPRIAPLSLGRRIVISVAAGLTAILALVGIVALWTIQESTEAAYQERVALAGALAQHVDDVLRYALVTLEREAISLRIEPGRPLSEDQRRQLADLRLRVGSFVILSVTDADGAAVWTEPSRADVVIGNPVEHPSVQLAWRTARPQITEFASPIDPQAIFACLAVLLRDTEGRLAGVLMAELDPGHAALNLLPYAETNHGTQVQLTNAAGRLVAGAEGPGASTIAAHQRLLADAIAARVPGYRVHEPPPGASFSTHLVAYVPLSLLPTWGVFVEQPKDVVVAVPERLRQRLTLAGLLALLLAAAIAWFDVRRVVGPLRDLTAAAERFAAGQLDQPVSLSRADELGVLASAFETMRQRLRASLAEVAEWNRELERRVAGRTAEVEAHNRERAALLQRLIDGQEEERRRLAQELHDDTSQALTSLRLGLERLAAGGENPARARRLAAELQVVAAQTLAAVHQLAVELRPSILDDIGLIAAVERYARENARRWGLAVDVQTLGVDRLRLIPAAETAIYRIVQAAFTNIAQHAQARHVSVLFQRREEMLVVVVEDDGRGFDLDAVRSAPLEARLGLAGMEERAALINATLTIETAPEAGTTVFLEVPLCLNGRREESDVQAADHPR